MFKKKKIIGFFIALVTILMIPGVKNIDAKSAVGDQYITGYIQLPDEKHAESITDRGDDYVPLLRGTREEIPTKWDFNNFEAYMPPLKNQGQFGSCWAMATMAAAEINLRIKGLEAPDLSEVHLAYFSYNSVIDPLGGTEGDSNKSLFSDSCLDHGGNYLMAAYSLPSWRGAAADVGELQYPESPDKLLKTIDPGYAYDDVAHLRNCSFINLGCTDITQNQSVNNEDMKAAKRAIMEHGSLAISYYALNGSEDQYSTVYNATNNAYYDSNNYGGSTNHAVLIVGWDDNFPKEKFGENPPGDGAWLVRNSWMSQSTTQADNMYYYGYFWMSYYNASLDDTAYAFDFDVATNYDNNYQYDGTTNHIIVIEDKTAVKGANIFQAKASEDGEVLKAVSLDTDYPNFNYEIKIYLSEDEVTIKQNPEAGTLARTQTGTLTFAGWHTVELDNPVDLKKGQFFSVVVEMSKEGKNVSLNAEKTFTSEGWRSVVAHIDRGESFLYDYNNGKWTDLVDHTDKSFGNLCIKAFTVNKISSPVNLKESNITVNPGSYIGKPVTPKVTVRDDKGTVINASEYTVAYSNNTDLGNGSVTVTANEDSTKCSGSATKSFPINIPLSWTDRYYQNGSEPTKFDDVQYIDLSVVLPLRDLSRNICLKYGEEFLREGVDFEEIDPDSNIFPEITGVTQIGSKSYPTVVFKIQGKGKYRGEQTVKLALNPLDIGSDTCIKTSDGNTVLYEGVEISEIPDQVYSPEGNRPEVTVTDKKRGVLVEDRDYTVSYAGNTEVTDSAKVIIKGKGNYTGTLEKTFKIKVKPITISVSVADKEYDGTVDAYFSETPKIVGITTGPVVTLGGGKASFKDANAGKDKEIVLSGFTLSGEGAKNYELSLDFTVTASILQKEIGLSWENTEYVYDGSQKCPKASATGLVGKDTCQVTVSGGGVNAGDYTVTATGISNGNYKLPANNTYVFNIAKAGQDKPAAPVKKTSSVNSIALEEHTGYEYRLGNGEWKASASFTGLQADTEYTFYQRIKADENHNASESSEGTVIRTEKAQVSGGTYNGYSGGGSYFPVYTGGGSVTGTDTDTKDDTEKKEDEKETKDKDKEKDKDKDNGTKPEIIETEDGITTKTVTTSGNGTVTTVLKTENHDNSSSITIIKETVKGKVVSSTVKVNADGSFEEYESEEYKSGNKNYTATFKDKDGNIVGTEYFHETVGEDGSSTSEGIKTDAKGNTEITTGSCSADGEKTEVHYQLEENGNVKLVGVDTDASSITIPATFKVNGKKYKVDAISKGAFKGNKTLTEITIGKYVRTIGKKAFAGARNLKSIIIKGAIEKVYEGAFRKININAVISIKAKKSVYKSVVEMIKKSGVSSTVSFIRIK